MVEILSPLTHLKVVSGSQREVSPTATRRHNFIRVLLIDISLTRIYLLNQLIRNCIFCNIVCFTAWKIINKYVTENNKEKK